MSFAPLVFIVEQNLDLADIYSATLEGAGMATRVVYDGESALAQLRQLRPALIMLDLNLPRISGAQLFNHIRRDERLKNTWVLLATGDASQAAELRNLERDNHHILTLIKPITVTELRQVARKLVFSLGM